MRRLNGEGSLFQRADGRWCGELSYIDASGKRKKRTVYAKTRKEANAKLKELIAQHEAGLQLDQANMIVSQFLEMWLTEHVQHRCRPSTVHGYTTMVRRYIVPAIGGIELLKLRALDVERMTNAINQMGKGRTAQYARSVLSRALNKALRWELINRNVAALAEPPQHESRPGMTLTPDQARAFLAAVAGDRWEAAYWLLLGAGLRRGEVLGLLVENIDLQAHELHVNGSLAYGTKTGLMRGPTKTKTSKRTIPLTNALEQLIRRRLALRAHERGKAGKKWHETGLLFCTANGLPIWTFNFHREFKRHLAQAGLDTSIRIHDMRHSFVSLALASGADVRAVADLAGHADASITLDRYAHSFTDTRRAAAQGVNALLMPDVEEKDCQNACHAEERDENPGQEAQKAFDRKRTDRVK